MIYAPHILVAIIKDSKSSQLVVAFPLANTTFLFGICRFEWWTHCVRLHYEWNLPTFTKDLGILITFLPRFWIAAASDLALLLLLPPLTSSNSNPSPSWQFHFDGIHLVWLWLHKFGAVCDRAAMRCKAMWCDAMRFGSICIFKVQVGPGNVGQRSSTWVRLLGSGHRHM